MSIGGKREGAGRPKGGFSASKKTVIEMAMQHGGAAIQVLFESLTAEDSSRKDKISAANSLLDRGFGRPAQSIHTTPGEKPVGFVAAMPPVAGSAEDWATANGGSIIVEDDGDKD